MAAARVAGHDHFGPGCKNHFVTYSDILATTAIVLSLLTAGWTGIRAWRWDRPIVSVSGEQWIGGHSTEPDRKVAGFSIEVINIGNLATSIIEAYWEIDRGNGVEIHFTASHGGGGIDSLFGEPDYKKVPELPLTLERYGRVKWEFEIGLKSLLEPDLILRERPVVRFTSRKRTQYAFGSWQPSQIAMDARRGVEGATK